MTNFQRFKNLKEIAESKGLTLSFAGYSQSKRGNESLYKIKSIDLILKKGRLPEISKFLENVNPPSTFDSSVLKTWTVKSQDGFTIHRNITDIDEWLKNMRDVFVIGRFNSIKEIIIEAPRRKGWSKLGIPSELLL